MKYTAEEVRAMAKMVGDEFSPHAGSMLTAYAERIEADEVAVTDLVVDKICNAALGHDNYGYETQDQVRTALLSVWPKPPAQAAQVDAFADRLRQSIMRDTFQPTADPVAQGEPVAGIQVPREGLPRVAQFIPYPAWLRLPPGIHGLFTTPPAQPAQSVDIGAIREVIESHINEAKKLRHDPESQDYLYEQADKLEAAIKGVE